MTPFVTDGVAERSQDLPLEDERLRAAAQKLLQSSDYAALRRLRCEVTDAVVIVQGIVPSYFLKQTAQETFQQLDGIRCVTNLVEVRRPQKGG